MRGSKDLSSAELCEALLRAQAHVTELIRENEELKRKVWGLVPNALSGNVPTDDQITNDQATLEDNKRMQNAINETSHNIKKLLLETGKAIMTLLGRSNSERDKLVYLVKGKSQPTTSSPFGHSRNETLTSHASMNQDDDEEFDRQYLLDNSEPLGEQKTTLIQSFVDQINSQDMTLRARLVTIRKYQQIIEELEERLRQTQKGAST